MRRLAASPSRPIRRMRHAHHTVMAVMAAMRRSSRQRPDRPQRGGGRAPYSNYRALPENPQGGRYSGYAPST